MLWPLLILGFCLVLSDSVDHQAYARHRIPDHGRWASRAVPVLFAHFPGVLIHELSHALAAWLMGVKVRRMSLGIRRKGTGGQVSLGSVDIGSTGPIRASLIGLAPFVAGSIAILIIGGQVFNLQVPTPFTLPQLLAGTAQSVQRTGLVAVGLPCLCH